MQKSCAQTKRGVGLARSRTSACHAEGHGFESRTSRHERNIMTDEERQYRDALGVDFIKFSNIIMLSYFLNQFRSPYDELDKLMKAWMDRITTFRENAFKDTAEKNEIDEDVAKILCSIHDSFDREGIAKEVSELIYRQIRDVMKNI